MLVGCEYLHAISMEALWVLYTGKKRSETYEPFTKQTLFFHMSAVRVLKTQR